MEVLCLGVERTGIVIDLKLSRTSRKCMKINVRIANTVLQFSGTDSMRVPLKILGYDDCYHGYSTVHENPPDNELWTEAMDAKYEGKGKPYTRKEWDSLLGHCRAVSDLPCVAFSHELIEAYPDAKVILTHPPKGVDRWYESCCTTLLALRDDWTRDAWAFFNNQALVTRKTFWRSFNYFWKVDFRANAKSIINKHSESIRTSVPKEKLLEYKVI